MEKSKGTGWSMSYLIDSFYVPHPLEFSLQEFVKGKYSSAYMARHVLFFLRSNMELLDDPDYDRLYKEMMDIYIWRNIFDCGWKPQNKEKNRKKAEFFLNLNKNLSKEDFECFSKEEVDRYLAHRRASWATEDQELIEVEKNLILSQFFPSYEL